MAEQSLRATALAWERSPQFCAAEFLTVRQEVEKARFAVNAAGQRKVGGEEICVYVTTYSVAALKLVEWAESNVRGCSIPVQIVEQLKQAHSGTEKAKEKVCAAARNPRLVPSPLVPSPRLPSPRLHIAVWLPGAGQVVLFLADSAPSAALSPKSGG